MAPFVKLKECKHVANNDVTWVLDSVSQLPPHYSNKGIVSYLKSKRLLVLLDGFFFFFSVENHGN